MPHPSGRTPADLAWYQNAARLHHTPCGSGRLVWRNWGAGAPVLLLHGGHGSWNHFIRNLGALLDAGYAVWAPDLPGMGESDLPDDPWTPDSLAEIIEAGLAQLIGGKTVDVAGFSFGGMVGGHLAALHPERVRNLILLGAGAMGMTSEEGIRMQNWRKVNKPAERRPMHLNNLLQHMLPDPALADDYVLDMHVANVEADRLRNREVSRTDSLHRALARVRCPVHGIWGVDDAIYRKNRHVLAGALAELGAASLIFIGACGHWVNFQKADLVNARMLDILGRP